MLSTMEQLFQVLKNKLPDYLQRHGIDDPYKKFPCINPEHADSSPSAQVGRDGTYFKCFGCSSGSGDIFTAANILEQKPLAGDEFITENVMYLANMFSIDTSGILSNDKSKYVQFALRHNYIRAHKVVAEFLVEFTDKTPSVAFKKEVVRRKWKEKGSIELGVVGGCEFRDILKVLRENNFSDEFIKMSGLMRPDIFNIDSVIFTIYDEYGDPVAFYSRDTRYEEKKIEFDKKSFTNEVIKIKSPIKYNSSANSIGIYEKKLCPYGINDVKNYHKVIAVEGHGCKHNLKLNGINNVIALGGLELSLETINKLISFGVTHIVLFLDNDVPGYDKVKKIIRDYYGKINVEFSVTDMSEYNSIKDPDELIRREGPSAIKTLSEMNCIEWLALKSISEDRDEFAIAKEMASLIALEKSPVSRLRLIMNVSKILDIPESAISEEVDQRISVSKDRKSEFALKVLDEAKELIKHNPNALESAMTLIESRLIDLNKDNCSSELFSAQECLKGVVALKEREESGKQDPTIKTGFAEWDEKTPLPTKEAFCLFVSPPNSGKTAIILTTTVNVLDNNPNAMAILYTNDDSREIYINRLVSIISKLPINWIEMPLLFLDPDKKMLRESAFRKIMDWIVDERLIIKDVSHGSTVEFYGNMIQHYRTKYQDRHIFATMDNLHKMQTSSGVDGERERVKYISGLSKSFTVKYSCVIWASVEMNKFEMYKRHTTAEAIAETASLQYDANLIVFLWNELNSVRIEDALMFFNYEGIDYVPEDGYVSKISTEPIIEAIILKSKISSFKGIINFKFFADRSYMECVSTSEVNRLKATNLAAKKRDNPDYGKEKKGKNEYIKKEYR